MATVTVSGNVTDDSTNKPLSGATIKIYDRISNPSELKATESTNSDGDYDITADVQTVSAGRGRYSVIVQKDGFEPETRNRTVIRDTTMNFELIKM